MRAIVTAALPGPVRTVLLADSIGPPMTDPAGYTFEDILTWLTGSFGSVKPPHTALLPTSPAGRSGQSAGPSTMQAWGISEQVNCWAINLPPAERLSLMASLKTRIGDYRLLFVPGKFLEIRRLRKLWRIFDVSGFWPSEATLAEILTRWGLADDPAATDLWEDDSRREWPAQRLPAIADRATARARIIARLMGTVLPALDAADLKPTWLHGVGAIGSRLLREANAPRWVARYRPDRQPTVGATELLPLMLAAYYGGRTETTVAGSWTLPTYDYDLRSAYPWALAWLPPVGYRWEAHDRFAADPEARMSLWYVRWDVGTCPLGPLPFRRQNGVTVYPTIGQGWYWWPEVRSALAAYGESAIRVLRGYVSPENSNPLLADMVRRRYAQRAELAALDDPTADILKGALQSVYGRLCQTVGADGLPGRFYNPALAGWVCSAVRARILDAYRGREGYVCAISTDGILSTRKLAVAASDRLGGWRVERYEHAALVLPGLYRLDGGFGADPLLRSDGLRGLPRTVGFDRLLGDLTRYQRASYPARWFVPNILPDLYPGRWESKRCRWTAVRSTVNPYAMAVKRNGAESLLALDWEHDFTWTTPYGRISDRDSESYPGPPAWQPGGVDQIREAMIRASR